MNPKLRAMLISLAVLCIGVALYFPISRYFENKALDDEMDALRNLKLQAVGSLEEQTDDADRTSDQDSVTLNGKTSETDPSAYSYDATNPQTDPSEIPQNPTPGAAGSAEETADGGLGKTMEENLRTPQVLKQPDSGLAAENAETDPGKGTDASWDVSGPQTGSTAQPGESSAPESRVTLVPGVPSSSENLTAPAPGEASASESLAAPMPDTTRPPASVKNSSTPEPGASNRTVAGQGNSPEATLEPSAAGAFSAATAGSKAFAQPEPALSPQPTPAPTPFVFDETKILPEYRPLYEINHDLVGWLKIDGTSIDYPVLQRDDEAFYLSHDFYGKTNVNGQLILDAGCDPYTPSLNLVISGHNMKSGKMFGSLQSFASASFARKHPVIEFDTLFRKGRYFVVTAFYTWDHEAREDGFRYNVDIRYSLQLSMFLDQLEPLKLYDTGVSIEFGDELIMFSTCSYQTDDGRFVVIARRARPDEEP